MVKRKRIGEILIDCGATNEEAIKDALSFQKKNGGRLGEILVKLKFTTEDKIAKALSIQWNIPFIEKFDPEKIDLELLNHYPIQLAKNNEMLPLYRNNGTLYVITSNPLNITSIGDMTLLYQANVQFYLATKETVFNLINNAYDKLTISADEVIEDIDSEIGLDSISTGFEEPKDLLDDPNQAPVIRFVNSLLTQAVKDRSSDIHIEPFEKDISIRFRIDGVLYEVLRPTKKLQASVTSRIKIMSGLNIAEKRLPQDGRIRIKIAGKDIDIRTSTIPVAHGERIVMRLLDKTSTLLTLDELGMTGRELKSFKEMIRRPHGIILLTGPTGSGKTTTLYGALTEINTPDKNILTVEDPIEYQLKGIGQMQVNPKINLTFASGLRHFLRQDPDVIMVGEIRDIETAEIAIQASLTGHLVFSTLHTNDAPSSITRLIDMGVEPFLVSSSLIGVMAQRLIRILCPRCKEPYTLTKEESKSLGLPIEKDVQIYRAKGCPDCLHTGYRGRKGIFELLIINDEIRGLITKGIDSSIIRKKAISLGMSTLRMDGLKKVLNGITTVDEVMRVTQEETVPIE